MSLGFGIVGCGMIAGFHAKAIKELEGARFVACQSLITEAADAFAEEHGGKSYEKLEDMLADPEIDVVTICTPSGAHMEPAIAAANAKKHVIVEKPLEVTVERCDAIIESCKKNGVVLSPLFPSRFHQSSMILKDAVDQGRFGRLTLGDAYVKWFRTQEYYDSGQWRGTWELDGGGALMNQAIHSVDLLVWLMGDVVEVSAQSALLAHERIEVEDTVVASLKFASGALGVIEATTAAFPGMLKKIEIHGSQGSAVIEEEDIKVFNFATPDDNDEAILKKFASMTETGGGAADPSAIGHAAHAKQFANVIEAINNDVALKIDGAEGRKSVEVIMAIYEAAKTGQRISLK